MFGWKRTAREKPKDHEFVRTSVFPFGVSLYSSTGFICLGKDIHPKWWRKVKNGDCLIRQISAAQARRTDLDAKKP